MSRWQNDAARRQSQLAHNWSDAWVRYLDHVVQFSIYHGAPQQQRERNLLRSVDDNKQASPLSQGKKREPLAPFYPSE